MDALAKHNSDASTQAGDDFDVPADVVDGCALYAAGGPKSDNITLRDAAKLAGTTEGFVWLALREPTAAQFAETAQLFHLPAFAVEDAIAAHQRPRVEVFDDLVFAVVRPVAYIDSEEVVEVSQIAVFLGPHFAITVRHGDCDVLAEVRGDLEGADAALLGMGSTALLYRLTDRVVDRYEEVATEVTTDVEDIEAQVFGDDELDHAKRIYFLKTELVEFRRAVAPLALPLSRLAEAKVAGVAEGSARYFRDVHDNLERTLDAIDLHDRMLTDVLSAHLAQVSVRQNATAARLNDDVRKISAWAAMAAVPTAIAGIYGMNFDNMPELGWRYGYFVVLGVMLAACLVLFRAFRRNGWL